MEPLQRKDTEDDKQGMQSNRSTVIFAAGASGGHIFPALAIAKSLKSKKVNAKTEVKTTFIGSGSKVEKQILGNKENIEYFHINSSAIRGKGILGALKFLFILPSSIFKCLKYYKSNNVKCVLGFGGYPSVIPVLAAKLIGLPIIIQEQNMYPGFANKFLSKLAKKIFCVPGAKGLPERKIEVMNPVREEFKEVKDYSSNSNNSEFKLLIMGGSQGAKSLNTAVTNLIETFKEKNFIVTHQCGEKDFNRIKKLYTDKNFNANVVTFISDLPSVFSDIDLIISRAGAMSIAEISASGRAAVYVPLNIAGGHQVENLSDLINSNAALMVKQDDKLVDNLREIIVSIDADKIKDLSSNAKKYYKAQSSSSTSKIVETINEFL